MHIYFHKGTSIWFFTISQSQFLKCNMGQAVFQRNFREGETMCTPCLSDAHEQCGQASSKRAVHQSRLCHEHSSHNCHTASVT